MEFRRFLPGDCNLTEPADDELQRVTAMLNITPCCCLGYRTTNEAFQHQLAALPKPRKVATDPIALRCEFAAQS